MTRVRLAVTVGVLLVLGSCVLACVPFLDLSADSLPYQDPTPEMVKKQAADIAAAEHKLAVHVWIAAALAVVGLAALIYAWCRRKPRGADLGP
jgi:hypothetical protein